MGNTKNEDKKRTEPPNEITVGDGMPNSTLSSQSIYIGDGRADPNFLLKPGLRLDAYELIEKIGEGGMGSVWKSRHIMLDRIVSLKFLPTELTRDRSAVNRFEREMRAVGKLDHPHIVRAMDAREVHGLYFLALEYVDGLDLAQLVKRHGPRSVSEACSLIGQAANGLAHAHASGLIHRDIKPSNLFLTKDGHLKVLDLGLALLLEQNSERASLTASGTIMGTPDYMAPEQWDDSHAVDERADLYSLGCTLCYLISGHAPFDTSSHKTVSQKMKGHVLERPVMLSELAEGIPPALDNLYTKLVAKIPKERLQSVAELAREMEQIARSLSDSASIGFSQAPERNERIEGISLLQQVNESSRRNSEINEFSSPKRPKLIAAGMGLLLVAAFVAARSSLFAPSSAQQESMSTISATLATPSSETTNLKAVTQPALGISPFDPSQAAGLQNDWAAYLGVPITYTNSIGMRFKLIPPGEFQMGLPESKVERFINVNPNDPFWVQFCKSAFPPHPVRIDQPFYLGECEVTQGQYQQIMKINPSHFSASGEGHELVADQKSTEKFPIELVSYYDAVEFCRTLAKHEGKVEAYARVENRLIRTSDESYRLPTEAEWEWACLAGADNENSAYGGHPMNGSKYVWSEANSKMHSHPVGALTANPFALFDMLGNVQEWVEDVYHPRIYARSDGQVEIDPRGPGIGSARIVRGGSWFEPSALLHSGRRVPLELSYHKNASSDGFRVVLDLKNLDNAQ